MLKDGQLTQLDLLVESLTNLRSAKVTFIHLQESDRFSKLLHCLAQKKNLKRFEVSFCFHSALEIHQILAQEDSPVLNPRYVIARDTSNAFVNDLLDADWSRSLNGLGFYVDSFTYPLLVRRWITRVGLTSLSLHASNIDDIVKFRKSLRRDTPGLQIIGEVDFVGALVGILSPGKQLDFKKESISSRLR
jgi:hypothetical protein